MNLVKIGAAGIAVALTDIIVPAAANAEPVIVEAVIDQPVIYVSYADLNLTEQAGVDRLNRRVHKAANRLCVQAGLQPVADVARDKACRKLALQGANLQIADAVANFEKNQYAEASSRKIAVALR